MLASQPFVRSIQTYISDTRLQLAIEDDFESTSFKWSGTSTPAGGTVTRITTNPLNGDACMNLATDAGTPGIGDEIEAYRWGPVPAELGLFQGEMFINPRHDPTTLDFDVHFRIRSAKAGFEIMPRINWVGADSKWYWYFGTGVGPEETGITTLSWASGHHKWTYLRVLADVENYKLLEVQVNDDVRQINGTGTTSGAVSESWMQAKLLLTTQAASQAQLNVDDLKYAFVPQYP